MKKNAYVFVCVVALTLLSACGGGGANYKSLTPGEMNPEGSFDGVFQSAAYGRMEMTVNGDVVVGLYEGERFFGKVEGTVDGDLMTFKWYQWNEDLNGKVRETTGHGYFRYTVVSEGTPENPRSTHFIKGEWGYGDDNAGSPWEAVKNQLSKKNLQPRSTGEPTNQMDADFENATAVDGSAPAKAPAASSTLDEPTESPSGNIKDEEVRSIF